MAPEARIAAVQSFPCPTCKTPADERCVTALGVPTTPHTERERLLLHEIQDQVRAAVRTADRHEHGPLRFRPPEAERLWLLSYRQRTGKRMNKILTEAVRALQAETERNGGQEP